MSDRLSQLMERVKSLVVDDKNLPTLQSLIYTNKDAIDFTFFDKLFNDKGFSPTYSMMYYIEQEKHQLNKANKDDDDDETVNDEISDDLVNKIAELDAAYEELKKENEALNAEKKFLENTNKLLKAEKETLEQHYITLEKNNINIEQNNEELQLENKELKTQNEHFRSILDADGKYVYRNGRYYTKINTNDHIIYYNNINK